MDPSREIVDPAQVGTALGVLSAVAAVLTLVLGARARREPSARGQAVLCGAGVLAFPMWLIYNGIEDRLGLDSVLALALNLALFAAVGTGFGLLYRRLAGPRPAEGADAVSADASPGSEPAVKIP